MKANEFEDFLENNFIEDDFGLWEFVERKNVELSFDDGKLTIVMKLRWGAEGAD